MIDIPQIHTPSDCRKGKEVIAYWTETVSGNKNTQTHTQNTNTSKQITNEHYAMIRIGGSSPFTLITACREVSSPHDVFTDYDELFQQIREMECNCVAGMIENLLAANMTQQQKDMLNAMLDVLSYTMHVNCDSFHNERCMLSDTEYLAWCDLQQYMIYSAFMIDDIESERLMALYEDVPVTFSTNDTGICMDVEGASKVELEESDMLNATYYMAKIPKNHVVNRMDILFMDADTCKE